jgi:hypothetical protein
VKLSTSAAQTESHRSVMKLMVGDRMATIEMENVDWIQSFLKFL